MVKPSNCFAVDVRGYRRSERPQKPACVKVLTFPLCSADVFAIIGHYDGRYDPITN